MQKSLKTQGSLQNINAVFFPVLGEIINQPRQARLSGKKFNNRASIRDISNPDKEVSKTPRSMRQHHLILGFLQSHFLSYHGTLFKNEQKRIHFQAAANETHDIRMVRVPPGCCFLEKSNLFARRRLSKPLDDHGRSFAIALQSGRFTVNHLHVGKQQCSQSENAVTYQNHTQFHEHFKHINYFQMI